MTCGKQQEVSSRCPFVRSLLIGQNSFDKFPRQKQLPYIRDYRLLYQDMYNNMTSQIKWNKYLTESFVEKQGVRQGGIPSTELSKTRGDKLLRNLETTHLGFRIGTVGVEAPACADDIILLSNSAINLQAMLDIAADDASQENISIQCNQNYNYGHEHQETCT